MKLTSWPMILIIYTTIESSVLFLSLGFYIANFSLSEAVIDRSRNVRVLPFNFKGGR
mgnify:CR=1 FL=1